MRRFRSARARLAVLPAAAVCLLLAGCEDPSGVGLTFQDPDASTPFTRLLEAERAEQSPLDDLTGAFLTSEGFADFRALAGRVDDPDFGTTTALAYLDVLPPQSFPDGFRDRPIRQATLRLERGYVYGDTTQPALLDLRQVSQEWDAVGAASDTLFPTQDAVITSVEVAPGTGLVEIALPESWVAANDTTLRSGQVSTLFHGFQLSPQAGSAAVYGFTGGSSLQLVSAEDTVVYRASELFSSIDTAPPPAPPADALVRLQDGTGTGLRLDFDVDTLGRAAISRVTLRVNADTAAAAAPPGFVRPLARQLALFGLVEGEAPAFIAASLYDPETQTFEFRSALLRDLVQDLVLEQSRLDGFAVGFLPSPSSLDVVPLVGPAAAACPDDAFADENGDRLPCRPRAVITLTGD